MWEAAGYPVIRTDHIGRWSGWTTPLRNPTSNFLTTDGLHYREQTAQEVGKHVLSHLVEQGVLWNAARRCSTGADRTDGGLPCLPTTTTGSSSSASFSVFSGGPPSLGGAVAGMEATLREAIIGILLLVVLVLAPGRLRKYWRPSKHAFGVTAGCWCAAGISLLILAYAAIMSDLRGSASSTPPPASPQQHYGAFSGSCTDFGSPAIRHGILGNTTREGCAPLFFPGTAEEAAAAPQPPCRFPVETGAEAALAFAHTRLVFVGGPLLWLVVREFIRAVLSCPQQPRDGNHRLSFYDAAAAAPNGTCDSVRVGDRPLFPVGEGLSAAPVFALDLDVPMGHLKVFGALGSPTRPLTLPSVQAAIDLASAAGSSRSGGVDSRLVMLLSLEDAGMAVSEVESLPTLLKLPPGALALWHAGGVSGARSDTSAALRAALAATARAWVAGYASVEGGGPRRILLDQPLPPPPAPHEQSMRAYAGSRFLINAMRAAMLAGDNAAAAAAVPGAGG